MLEMNYLNSGDNRWEKWNLNVDDTNFELAGAPGRTRTSNLLIRSQLLYPVELRAQLLILLMILLKPRAETTSERRTRSPLN